jgi:magnesium transporter
MSATAPPPHEIAPASRALAAYLDAVVATARPEETAGAMRARLAREHFAAIDPVFVLDRAHALAGAVRLQALLAAAEDAPLSSLMQTGWPRIPATATAEEAASEAIRSRTPALAVLDHSGAFLGALTPEAVMAILRDEHLEDLHHMVGILGRSESAKAALTAPPYRRALFRLPWLLVGVAGSVAATALMAGAEAILAAHIAVAFFVPALVYLTDAIGTQAEAVAVRGLSLSDGGTLRLLFGELGTGALLGGALGVFAFLGVWLVFGEVRLAVAVAASLVTAGTVATAVGFLLPWAFQRAGQDPAYGSGPVGTVVQDVLTLAVYLGLVTLLLA